MPVFATSLTDAQSRFAQAVLDYDTARAAARVKSDEGGSMIDLQRQELDQLQTAVEVARADMDHFTRAASGAPGFAPLHFGGGLR